jgi:hypothetical protein
MDNYLSLVSDGSSLASSAQSMVNSLNLQSIGNTTLSDNVNLNKYILIPELDLTSGASFEIPQWMIDNVIIQTTIKVFQWIVDKYNKIIDMINGVIKMVRDVMYELKMWLLQKLDSLVS